MSDKSGGNYGGMGFLPALTLLFIGLKLTGHINWSWWAVLSPLWGVLLFVIVVAVFAAWLQK